jgi:hypothetical protein
LKAEERLSRIREKPPHSIAELWREEWKMNGLWKEVNYITRNPF